MVMMKYVEIRMKVRMPQSSSEILSPIPFATVNKSHILLHPSFELWGLPLRPEKPLDMSKTLRIKKGG